MPSTGKPHAAKGEICPLHRRDVSKVCHTCPLWGHIRGQDPNTGAAVDEWRCALAWLPPLLIEVAQQSRQTGAAVESFRNEMVKLNGGAVLIDSAAARAALPRSP